MYDLKEILKDKKYIKEIEYLKEEKLNIARELVKNGVDINIIARSTGLPLEKLEELASMVQ